MYQTLEAEIVGTAPLLMHSGQTADPLNRYAKELKKISGKRNKTEADYAEMARIEFVAGLYMHDNAPALPARSVEAAIIEGARKSKLGRLALAGIVVERHAPLVYDGPKTPQELFKDEKFRFAVPVRVGQTKVVRTRPIFHAWSAKVVVRFLAEVINERDLLTAIRNAGQLCGIGDWRPRYGRFALRKDLPATQAAE